MRLSKRVSLTATLPPGLNVVRPDLDISGAVSLLAALFVDRTRT
jgi:hypothetical protein